MTDPFAEGPVHDQGDGAPFVIRLSKTASGSLTYTIGASLGRDEVPEATVEALFALRDLVEAGITAGSSRGKVREPSLKAQLRKSLIVEALRLPFTTHGKLGPTIDGGWMTTREITEAVKGHRSQVQTDLKALTEQGVVEYERGKGGNYPSRYRLAAEKGAKA